MKKVGVLFFLMSLFSNIMSSDINDLVEFYAKRENIDPLLVKSIIYHESRGNERALSSAGAVGLMQVMPATARFVGVDPSKLYTPDQNIKAGVLYLRFLKKNFRGDVRKMVAAYNAGHGAVEKYGGVPPYRETINYTRNVLDTYVRYKGRLPTRSEEMVSVGSVNGNKRSGGNNSTKPFLMVVKGQDSDVESYSDRDDRSSIRPSVLPATYVRSKNVNRIDNIRAVGNKVKSKTTFSQNNSSANSTSKRSSFIQIISEE